MKKNKGEKVVEKNIRKKVVIFDLDDTLIPNVVYYREAKQKIVKLFNEFFGHRIDEKKLLHTQAIIQSMTPEERKNPSMINGSRRKRIAQGSGTKVQEGNSMLKEFEQSRKMMKQFAGMEKKLKKGGGLKLPFFR
jgi:phosphoserine phosphatase